MTGLFQAIGFKDVTTVAAPTLLYLGNDKAMCDEKIADAIKSGKFARILRQNNFARTMLKVGLQQARLDKFDCSPEGNKKHLAKLASDRATAEETAPAEPAVENAAAESETGGDGETAKEKKKPKKNEK